MSAADANAAPVRTTFSGSIDFWYVATPDDNLRPLIEWKAPFFQTREEALPHLEHVRTWAPTARLFHEFIYREVTED